MTKSTILTARGVRHPNPDYYGFSWEEVQPLLEEHERLHGEHNAEHQHLAELQQELRIEQAALPGKRALAIRKGEKAPNPEKHIRGLEEKIKASETRLEDILRASDLATRDLQQAMEANRDSYLEDIEEMQQRALMEKHRISQLLKPVEWQQDAADKLARYFSKTYSSTGTYKLSGSISPRPEVPEEVGVDAG